MKILIILSILIVTVTAFKEWWEDTKAFELTSSNFMEVVGKDKYVFVKFYTRWCRYCREMANDYETLIENMKDKRSDVIIARLDGNMNEDISGMYNIRSYPSLVLFGPNSVGIKNFYANPRVASVMEDWLNTNAPVLEKPKPTPEPSKPQINTEEIALKEAKMNEEMHLLNENTQKEIAELKSEINSLNTTLSKVQLELQSVKNDFMQLIKDKQTEDVSKMPSNFSIIAFLGIVFIMIALVIVAQKFTSTKKLNIEDKSHV